MGGDLRCDLLLALPCREWSASKYCLETQVGLRCLGCKRVGNLKSRFALSGFLKFRVGIGFRVFALGCHVHWLAAIWTTALVARTQTDKLYSQSARAWQLEPEPHSTISFISHLRCLAPSSLAIKSLILEQYELSDRPCASLMNSLELLGIWLKQARNYCWRRMVLFAVFDAVPAR